MTLRELSRAWPLVVLALGSIDAVGARLDQPHRPVTADLFVQSLALWAAFATLALLPAGLVARFVPFARSRPGALLAFVTAGPVVAHAALDRHTSLGGDLSALASARPWLEVALALFVWGAVLWVVAAVADFAQARGRGATARIGLAIAALAAGLALPWKPGSSSIETRSTSSRP